ncbi:hypothetical protein T484DRAFT_1805472 [Baffinella frigidus]|nr:hypothetical protein T484DRAFT_1805472 [Cryptophyta sp. CCMP2293]
MSSLDGVLVRKDPFPEDHNIAFQIALESTEWFHYIAFHPITLEAEQVSSRSIIELISELSF